MPSESKLGRVTRCPLLRALPRGAGVPDGHTDFDRSLENAAFLQFAQMFKLGDVGAFRKRDVIYVAGCLCGGSQLKLGKFPNFRAGNAFDTDSASITRCYGWRRTIAEFLHSSIEGEEGARLATAGTPANFHPAGSPMQHRLPRNREMARLCAYRLRLKRLRALA